MVRQVFGYAGRNVCVKGRGITGPGQVKKFGGEIESGGRKRLDRFRGGGIDRCGRSWIDERGNFGGLWVGCSGETHY